jgi:hypothetical protein
MQGSLSIAPIARHLSILFPPYKILRDREYTGREVYDVDHEIRRGTNLG